MMISQALVGSEGPQPGEGEEEVRLASQMVVKIQSMLKVRSQL
jgi:hypothetical protein